ncbi:MAG: DUF1615 domain-containing protein [Burkholderiales bacterium]
MIPRVAAVALALALAACATPEQEPPSPRPMTASEGRALIVQLLPESVKDKSGWATDLYAAFASLDLRADAQGFCAAIAIIGQESGFDADPAVPGLAKIARAELDRRRESAGIPRIALDAALALPSTNGKSYGERLDAVRTERQLSELYEDFIGRVPFGKSLLSDRNPVRTGGPMQVSIAFAESMASERPYPYPVGESIRHEVFTRRGGVYFGVAHLLDYPASYGRPLYRFADYNAGWYASRNAAFQQAVTQASGVPLTLDGDLLRYENGNAAREPGSTELAVRVLAKRIDMTNEDIRRDLLRARSFEFESTRLWSRVFALVDAPGKPAPRAVLPQIPLSSPKITRPLTTEWFANRVQGRYESCMKRAPA